MSCRMSWESLVTNMYITGKEYTFGTFDRKENAENATTDMDSQLNARQQIKVMTGFLSKRKLCIKIKIRILVLI